MRQFEIPTELVEGGNVFKTKSGEPHTRRIQLSEIPETLEFLEKVAGVPTHNMTLGSVGKKSTSGDLDIVVDSKDITKEELSNRLKSWATSQGLDPNEFVQPKGEVHFLTPIKGDPTHGYVQTDFFFHEDPNWMLFSMSSPGDASQHTGAERNQLMSSIAKAQGLKYSWQRGLLRREDDAVISKDPDEIAQKLLGQRFTQTSLDSVESIQQAIKSNQKLRSQLSALIQTLRDPAAVDPRTGEAVMDKKTGLPKQKPPGELRKTNEEADRITQLTGVKG